MKTSVTALHAYRMNLIEAVRGFTGDKIAEEVADAIERSWWAAGMAMHDYGGLMDNEKLEIVKKAFPALIGAK